MNAGYQRKKHGRYKDRADVVTTEPTDVSAAAYLGTKPFLDRLRKLVGSGVLTVQEARTLRGQAINGDPEGARIGLFRMLERK